VDQLDSVYSIIFDAIDELNAGSSGAKLTKTRETVLFGVDGSIDSVDLVNLVVGVEQGLEDKLGVSLSLASEKTMSQKESPFRTVRTLAEYVVAELVEDGADR
jgi:acyl carrier protein